MVRIKNNVAHVSQNVKKHTYNILGLLPHLGLNSPFHTTFVTCLIICNTTHTSVELGMNAHAGVVGLTRILAKCSLTSGNSGKHS